MSLFKATLHDPPDQSKEGHVDNLEDYRWQHDKDRLTGDAESGRIYRIQALTVYMSKKTQPYWRSCSLS